MQETIKRLVDFYQKKETVELSWIFEKYMKSISAKKLDRRRKDCSNTYLIDGKTTNWNRVECYYHKENDSRYGTEDLEIVLRKRNGSYLIVARKLERALEISYGKIISLNEDLLKQIVEDHKALFDAMCYGFERKVEQWKD